MLYTMHSVSGRARIIIFSISASSLLIYHPMKTPRKSRRKPNAHPFSIVSRPPFINFALPSTHLPNPSPHLPNRILHGPNSLHKPFFQTRPSSTMPPQTPRDSYTTAHPDHHSVGPAKYSFPSRPYSHSFSSATPHNQPSDSCTSHHRYVAPYSP